MPHRCTKCGRLYEDGDMNILNGCICGNNKFLYVPKETIPKETNLVKDKEINEDEIEIIRTNNKSDKEEDIESVKIISPGQYEINIENLLKRDGLIIKLQEEGRYIIHLPSLLKKKNKKKNKINKFKRKEFI